MRNISSFKKFNSYKVSIEMPHITVKGKFATQRVLVPSNAIPLAVNRFFFKSKSQVFLFKALVISAINNSIRFYFKRLTLKGIGFKCYKLTDKLLLLKIGYTHKIYYLFDKPDVNFYCKKGKMIIYGNNMDAINNIVYNIKNLRQPDSYKGKGIIFTDQILKLKSSKKRI